MLVTSQLVLIWILCWADLQEGQRAKWSLAAKSRNAYFRSLFGCNIGASGLARFSLNIVELSHARKHVFLPNCDAFAALCVKSVEISPISRSPWRVYESQVDRGICQDRCLLHQFWSGLRSCSRAFGKPFVSKNLENLQISRGHTRHLTGPSPWPA